MNSFLSKGGTGLNRYLFCILKARGNRGSAISGLSEGLDISRFEGYPGVHSSERITENNIIDANMSKDRLLGVVNSTGSTSAFSTRKK